MQGFRESRPEVQDWRCFLKGISESLWAFWGLGFRGLGFSGLEV